MGATRPGDEGQSGWSGVSNTFVTTVRFNLDREEDCRALEYLQGEGRNRYGSYTQAIITAVNRCRDQLAEKTVIEADPEKEKEEAFLQRIEETIRRAIAESPIGNLTTMMRLFQTIPAASVPTTTVTPPEPHMDEQPEEDWSAADDFMSGF